MGLGTAVITGVSSFVGYHLASAYSERGWQVLATLSRDRAEYDGVRAQRLRQLDGRVDWQRLDLREAAQVQDFVDRYRPRVWVQHAGFATQYGSFDFDVEAAHRLNVQPLPSLYSALSELGAEGIIVTGSSAEYSPSGGEALEDAACFPRMPYGASKLAETVAAVQLSQQYGLATRVARVFIPFGPLDNDAKLLPSVVARLRVGEPVDLSPCEQERDFVHVDDLAEAYMRLTDDLSSGGWGVYNVCRGEATGLKDLLINLAQAMGADVSLLRFGARAVRPGEPEREYGSSEKIRSRLGWRPTDLGESIRRYLRELETIE